MSRMSKSARSQKEYMQSWQRQPSNNVDNGVANDSRIPMKPRA